MFNTYFMGIEHLQFHRVKITNLNFFIDHFNMQMIKLQKQRSKCVYFMEKKNIFSLYLSFFFQKIYATNLFIFNEYYIKKP